MNANAAPQAKSGFRFGVSLSLLTAVVGLLTGLVLVGPATAASPVKNGQVRACYKVKGKPKGAMRAVKGKRCRRGERRLTWSVVGPAGAAGAAGSQGSTGSQGPQGAPGVKGNPGTAGTAGGSGAGTSLTNLETKVASLSLEVKTLEDLLEGVSGGDLSGLLAKLNGISATQLNEAVGAVPTVDSLVPKVSDLEGLLNSRAAFTEHALTSFPNCQKSLMTYGLRDFSTMSLSNGHDRAAICRSLEQSIGRHEPRLHNVQVTLEGNGRAVGGLHFSIHGLLDVQPAREPISFDAMLQPSTLQYSVSRLRRASAA